MSRCRSCGAEVVWSKTENDRNIPLDPEPVLGGNVILECHGALARVVEPVRASPEAELRRRRL